MRVGQGRGEDGSREGLRGRERTPNFVVCGT